MDVKQARENIESEQMIAVKPVIITVEAEAALPGSLRDEARVYLADAFASIVGSELMGNRVSTNGRVNFHALFAQGDLSKISAVDTSKTFSQQLSLSKEAAGNADDILTHADVQQVTTRVFNGRILFKATVQVDARVISHQEVSVISNLTNVLDAETAAEQVKIVHVLGRGTAENLIKDELELPDAEEISETLYGTAHAQIEDITGGADGKIGVSGKISLEAYHRGADSSKPLRISKHELPFEQSVILSGALGDTVSASAEIYDVALALKEGQGVPVLRAEVLLHTEVKTMDETSQQILTDVYGTESMIYEPSYVPISLTKARINTQAAESGKATIMLPEDAPRIRQPIMAQVRPAALDSHKNGDKLTVEGVLSSTLIYQTDDQTAPVAFTSEEPFSIDFKTDAAPEDLMKLTATDAQMNAITGDRAEIKYIMHLSAEGLRQTSGRYVAEINEKPAEAKELGIDLYFVGPSETIWALGKRAGISIEKMKQLNPALQEPPEAGSVVTVYRQ